MPSREAEVVVELRRPAQATQTTRTEERSLMLLPPDGIRSFSRLCSGLQQLILAKSRLCLQEIPRVPANGEPSRLLEQRRQAKASFPRKAASWERAGPVRDRTSPYKYCGSCSRR